MKKGRSCFMGLYLANLNQEEFEVLERLLSREQHSSGPAQVREVEMAAARETELLDRIRTLEEQMASLEAKEIDGRTERRVSQRRTARILRRRLLIERRKG